MLDFIAFNYLVENGLLGTYWNYSVACFLGIAILICTAFCVSYCRDGRIATGVLFGLGAAVCFCYLIYMIGGVL